MTQAHDDLEAVRQIADTLKPFNEADRERILRWVRERLGMNPAQQPSVREPPAPSPLVPPTGSPPGGPKDIRSFISQKNPQNERHLAAVVAYFYQLEAPQNQRKDAIGSQDLTDACRTANWKRPRNPAQTLINAFKSGYIDKAGERGRYRLNAVGENLVAMVLPEGQGASAGRPTPKAGKVQRKPAKKAKRPPVKRSKGKRP